MRVRKYTTVLSPVTIPLLFLPSLTYVMSFDCSSIRADKQSFDISPLGNPISVMTSEDHSPSPTMTNTTFTMDICKPLKKAQGIPIEEDCTNGSMSMSMPISIFRDPQTSKHVPLEYLGSD